MNKEIMSTKEELLDVMRKYGIKEYYTSDGYELGGNPRGWLVIETKNEEFKKEFYNWLFKGFDEENDIRWVYLMFMSKMEESDKSEYQRNIIV